MEPFEELTIRIENLEKTLKQFIFPDKYLFPRNIELGVGKKITNFIYGGSVTSAGVATALPVGWTSAKTATGTYVVTHNLATVNYAVAVTPFATSNAFKVANILAQTATAFTVDTTLSGVDTDSAFFFILILI